MAHGLHHDAGGLRAWQSGPAGCQIGHKALHAVRLSPSQLLDQCCAFSKNCSRPKGPEISSAAVCRTGAQRLWVRLPGALMCLTCPLQDNPKQRAAAQQINGWSDNPENVDISAVSVLDDDGASGVGAAAAAAVSVALARSWASAASQKQVSHS